MPVDTVSHLAGVRLPENPVEWIRREYHERRNRNQQYSLRAFARLVGISPGALWEIIRGKRPLSLKTAQRIADRLAFSPVEKDLFLRLASGDRDATYVELSEDRFALIAEWHHYALISLLETTDCQFDVHWLARRLGLIPSEITASLDLLERLGLIEKSGVGYRTLAALTTSQDVPSTALKQSHREGLEQAIQAIEQAPLQSRDISSITMAINVSQIPKAKELIRKFRRDLSGLLESGVRSEVYNLNIQLVPVTKEIT